MTSVADAVVAWRGVMSDHERRYTDEELSRIFGTALAPQRGAPALRAGGRGGWTLAELQAIAAEIGVAPGAVARAARNLPAVGESELARRLGGAARTQLSFTLPPNPDPAMPDRLLETLRGVTGQQGEVTRTGTTLEFRAESLAVNVTTAGDATRVMILSDRSVVAGLIGGLGTLAAGFAIGITGAVLEPSGIVPVGGLILGLGTSALLVGRTLWARSTRSCRRLLARVTDAVAEVVEGGQRPTG